MKSDLTGGIEDINQSLKLAPKLVEGWHNRGVLLLMAGRLDEAEAAIAKVKELGGELKPDAERMLREARERAKKE